VPFGRLRYAFGVPPNAAVDKSARRHRVKSSSWPARGPRRWH